MRVLCSLPELLCPVLCGCMPPLPSLLCVGIHCELTGWCALCKDTFHSHFPLRGVPAGCISIAHVPVKLHGVEQRRWLYWLNPCVATLLSIDGKLGHSSRNCHCRPTVMVYVKMLCSKFLEMQLWAPEGICIKTKYARSHYIHTNKLVEDMKFDSPARLFNMVSTRLDPLTWTMI